MLTPLPTYSLTPSLPNLDPLHLLFFSFPKQPRCLLPHLRSFFKNPFLLRPLLVIQSKTANALPLHHTLFFFFSLLSIFLAFTIIKHILPTYIITFTSVNPVACELLSGRNFCLFGSLLSSQGLEKCLACRMCPLIGRMNE